MITLRFTTLTLVRLGAALLFLLGLSLAAGHSLAAAPPAGAAGVSTGAAAQPASSPTPDFQDVPASAPYYAFLHDIFTQGIVAGYNCGGPGEPCGPGNLPYYRPNNTVTRAQMSKFVDLARTQPGAAFEAGTSGVIPVSGHTTDGNAVVAISNNGDGVFAYSSAGGGALYGQGIHSYGVVATSAFSEALYVDGKAHVTGGVETEGHVYAGGTVIANEFGSTGQQGLLVVGSAYVDGNFHTTGTCCGAENLTTQIDDPRDAAHKTLNQAAVVASEQLAVYSGNVTTDKAGLAVVTLPAYVQAVDGDFRYQLTVVGQFAQAIIAQEIAANHFTIQTDKPDVKVSWQVIGVRTDPAAAQHPLVVQQDKAPGK